MGNTSSASSGGGKKFTREERKKTRENVEQAKASGLQARKDDISKLQGDFLGKELGRDGGSDVLERSVTVAGGEKLTAIQFINATEAAKVQLERGGGPFTKTDLVAIAMALSIASGGSGSRVTIESLRALTIPDLNAYIRTVVYDPSKFIATPSTSSTEISLSPFVGT